MVFICAVIGSNDLQRGKIGANTRVQVKATPKTFRSSRHGSANPPMDVF